MSRGTVRGGLYAAIALAFLLHQDVWWWDSSVELLGLPIGLTYHIGFCGVAVGLMALLVRYAWPEELETEASRDRGHG